MSTSGRTKLLVVVVVWLVLIGIAAIAYRLVFVPSAERSREHAALVDQYERLARQAEVKGIATPKRPPDADIDELARLVEEMTDLLTGVAGGGGLARSHSLSIALDSFSGYAILRSDAFRDALARRDIGLRLVDDGADYNARLRALERGTTPMAVFTIDALLSAAAERGDLPGTIVLVLDETTGADAMVTYESAVPDIDALDRADARIVVTPDSPSETLARVVLANFSLDALPDDPFVAEDGAAEVYRRFLASDRSAPRAYVMWEPYVSKALEEPGTRVVMDSSRFRGFIVDVLVVQRQYLIDHEARVAAVVEAYLRALYDVSRDRRRLQELVRDDAARSGEPLNDTQVTRLVDGIWWKNTQENYAHFGLLAGAGGSGLPGLDAMIANIADVLVRTGAIASDPTGGNPGSAYYDRILRSLRDRQFHPGVGGGGGGAEVEETIRAAGLLRDLSDEEWEALVPVGTLSVERIAFARGTSRLTRHSEQSLRSLAETLGSFPQYYLVIRGHARAEGDREANRRLAADRASAARAFLESLGVPAARLRSVAIEPRGTGGRQQSVSFVLGQTPY